MSHFCLLSAPGSYVAHDWDFLRDSAAREHWLDLFAKHFQETLRHARAQYGRAATKPIQLADQQFSQAIQQLRANPSSLPNGKLNVVELCRLRESVLRQHKLNDPFGYIKVRENAAAAKLYPQVVRRIHVMDDKAKWLHLIECVFAGNMFDLGSASTMHLADESPDFLTVVENTKPRPWLVDDYDRLEQDLLAGPPIKWGKVVVFVDNAGSDFLLGVMPLVRELALAGTKVVLAANELPSLNDITADEAANQVELLTAVDEDLAALVAGGMLEVVSSGNDIPLIYLSGVTDELNQVAADADLVVLEGMGRAVESNFDAHFKVDALHLALLKDPSVAARVGGQVYDCVCKYTPKAGGA
jgi:type II pantothenate kinase